MDVISGIVGKTPSELEQQFVEPSICVLLLLDNGFVDCETSKSHHSSLFIKRGCECICLIGKWTADCSHSHSHTAFVTVDCLKLHKVVLCLLH